MSTIIFTRVEFNYTSPYSEIFSDLSLILDSTWRSGLVGRNGRGKTTFLKLLDGELEPVSGEITNTLSTRYFPGDVPAKGQSTLVVIRNLIAPYDLWESEMARLLELSDPDSLEAYSQLQSQYQDARGYKINGLIEREIQKMGLSREVLDRPFEVLSLGQQTQIQIVSLFLGQPTFALIDEPTNHLDIECRKALGDYLSQQHGFLLVSHDRALLNACTDHIISINRSDVRVNQGNWSTWRDEMEKELLSEARSRSQIESEVKQLQRTAQQRRQGADQKESEKYGNSHADTGFIGHKAAKQMKRAMNAERRVERQLEGKQALLKNQEKERDLIVTTQAKKGKTMLTVNNLTIDIADNRIVTNLSFNIAAGDRVALVGPNGCGKSSVLDAIVGKIGFDGTVSFRGRHLSRSWQQPLWSSGSLREHLKHSALNETRFRQYLGILDVRGDIFEQPLESFSQGQLKKVDLTRSLLEPAEVLLWDEPMNYLDVDSREMIEDGIIRGNPTMLVIEHDEQFIESVATTVINL